MFKKLNFYLIIIKNHKRRYKKLKYTDITANILGKNTLDTAISKKRNQSNNFIFDITKTEMTEEEAIQQINKIYVSKHRQWVDKIVLLKNTNVLKIYKRKK